MKKTLIITSGIMALSVVGWLATIPGPSIAVVKVESFAPDAIPQTVERQRIVGELATPYATPTSEDRARIRAELGL